MAAPETGLDLEVLLHDRLQIDLEKYMEFTEDDGQLIIKLTKYLSKEKWGLIHGLVREWNGEYDANNREWHIPKSPQQTKEEVEEESRELGFHKATEELTKPYEKMQEKIETKLKEKPTNLKSIITVDDEEIDLALSKEKVGPLVPILKDKYDQTIDGLHREKIGDWPSIKLEYIQDPVQFAAARLIANLQRRSIEEDEIRNLLSEIARLTSWTPKKIADEIGMSYRWVVKYLPQDFKDKEMAQLAAQRAAKQASIFKVELYNVWSFGKCDPRFGKPNFPGRVPGQIVTQLLYYYTNEGDLVVDPMAGSGTTYDACEYMRRKCLCYDITPIRDFIKPHDIRKGYPQEAKECSLIFLDPPYWKMKKEDYGLDSVSNEPLTEFLGFLEKLAKDSYDTVKPLGVVAILMADMTEKARFALSGETYILFKKVGFSCIDHISCPLSTQDFLPQQVDKAKKEKVLLGRNRDLYVFRKS